jgi:hypothetical protein
MIRPIQYLRGLASLMLGGAAKIPAARASGARATYHVMDCVDGEECVLFPNRATYSAAMDKALAELNRRPDADLSIWDSNGKLLTLKVSRCEHRKVT